MGTETDTPSGELDDGKRVSTAALGRLALMLTCVVLLGIIIAGTCSVLSHISHTLLIFSLGGLGAYAVEPIASALHRAFEQRRDGKKVPRIAAVGAVYVLAALLFAVSLFALSIPIRRQAALLAGDHAAYEAHANALLSQADSFLHTHGYDGSLKSTLQHPPANFSSWSQVVSERVLKLVEHAGKDVVEAFIVALISLYFLIYSAEMRHQALEALPETLRVHADAWMKDVNRILGGFVRGQVLLALSIGAMASILCLIMGIRLWLLIGVFVVAASLIPVVGPLIGAIPAVLAALFSPEAHFAPALRVVILIAAFGIINEVGSKILYPKLVGKALGLHEVLVLFILFAGAEAGGLTGVLFAAPLTALGSVTAIHLWRLWRGQNPASNRAS
jgi:predicted PurR-regulated permease PerM